MPVIDERNILTPFTFKRLDQEGMQSADIGVHGFPKWFAIINRGGINSEFVGNFNGDEHDYVTRPPDYQVAFGCRLAQLLNKQISHNGHWIVAFTHGPLPNFGLVIPGRPTDDWRRFIMLWLDEDGDPQFTVDNVEPFSIVAQASNDHWISDADKAWDHWKHLMRTVLAPRSDQLVKRAANS